MKTDKFKLFLLAIIATLIIAALSSCAGLDPAQRYAKEHEDRNFSYVMSKNESFTPKSLKDDIKTLNKKVSELKKKGGDSRKIESMEAKLAKLREEIKELENN